MTYTLVFYRTGTVTVQADSYDEAAHMGRHGEVFDEEVDWNPDFYLSACLKGE